MARYRKQEKDWLLSVLKRSRSNRKKWRYIFAWEVESREQRGGWREDDWKVVFQYAFKRQMTQLEVTMARALYDT